MIKLTWTVLESVGIFSKTLFKGDDEVQMADVGEVSGRRSVNFLFFFSYVIAILGSPFITSVALQERFFTKLESTWSDHFVYSL